FGDFVVRPCTEHLVELIIQPGAGWRTAKQIVVLAEQLPYAPRLTLQQVFQRHAVGVQQAQDVVVGLNDQRRRLRKRRVLGENARIHMAVRRDDRQRLRLFVQRARGAPDRGIGIEKAVGIQTVGAQPGAYSRDQ